MNECYTFKVVLVSGKEFTIKTTFSLIKTYVDGAKIGRAFLSTDNMVIDSGGIDLLVIRLDQIALIEKQ